MKITINLSPSEILKLGKLTDADFAEAFSPLVHTHDDISFAIHRLINMIDEIETYDEDLYDECDINFDEYDINDDGYYNDDGCYHIN